MSPATVSRVLSDSSYPVRERTRQRVLEAVAELDFRPNLLARGLVTSQTNTIGAIVHDISDPYFGEIVRGLEEGAREHGYRVFACSSDRDAERELGYVEELLAHRVDALVLAGGGITDKKYQAKLRQRLTSFRNRGGAVVLLAPRAYRAPSVAPDNRAAAEAMTNYLLSLGHRSVGFINGPPSIMTSDVRLEGYRTALLRAGIDFDFELVEDGSFTSDGGGKAMRELLARRPELTAVFAANDVMAFGACHELADHGIAVPGEISVAGYDDVQLAAYVSPPLTTVRMGLYEMGQAGSRVIFDLLAGKRVRSRPCLFELVLRSSTASPRSASS